MALRLDIDTECKPYFGRLRGFRQIQEMSRQTPKQQAMEETADTASFRPVGLSISSFFYALSGFCYLAFPIVTQDTFAYHSYSIWAASRLGCLGWIIMTRTGLGLGMVLLAVQ